MPIVDDRNQKSRQDFDASFGRTRANAANVRSKSKTAGVPHSGSAVTSNGQSVYNGANTTKLTAGGGGARGGI